MKILISTLLFLSCQLASAQDYGSSKADSLLNAIEEHDEGMGSVAVLKDGQLLYQKAYGFAEIKSKQKNNPNTLFRIGSISKTYTATLVMKAVEEGLLKLDDKLSKFYPEFENSDQISISHMLQHRSGLYNFTNSPFYVQYMTQAKTKSEMLEILLSTKNNFRPDEGHEYSNTAYVLLSYILEDVYGLKYGDILKEKILVPLKLENTYFAKAIDQSANASVSYFRTAQWEVSPETNMMITMGAGGISATAKEVAIFYEALFNGEILEESSLSKMKEIKDGFGYGLFQMPYYDQKILGHTGGIDGFQSVAVHLESENLTVVILCNAVSYKRNDILLGLLAAYFGKEFEIPDFKAGVALQREELIDFEGVYSSETFPLKITISIADNSQLMAQATGQSAFPLTAINPYSFKFDPAGIKIVFDSENSLLTLEQNGMKFKLKKEVESTDD
ncbi:serine hydrolase domain-containing protein [Marivirga harenae]|uniref:serine hydrolase domain-containing protein n=1 Tax=Marivirga harenae TaxID=2010992 RepID=UPI0026DF4165|nr:serine hydrolase domain-containing protein [Marivirga harenae]WKV10836.1 serine hydrolase domain-containing protein [Marivirga harenae]